MRRSVVVLAFVVGGLLAVCLLLWRELGEQRAINAGLQARLDAVPAPEVKTAVARTTVALAPANTAQTPALPPALSATPVTPDGPVITTLSMYGLPPLY